MPSQVHAFHILVKTEEEARQILSDLKNGASFEKLAQLKSQHNTGKNFLQGEAPDKPACWNCFCFGRIDSAVFMTEFFNV